MAIWCGRDFTYCVRRVNAALVILEGKCKPLMISCHNFLLITSTKPPRAITKLYNSYRSKTDFAIIGNRLIGVPENNMKKLLIILNIDEGAQVH